jgi:hypothetical protein
MARRSSRTATTQAAGTKRKAGTKSTVTKTSSAQKPLSSSTAETYTPEQMSLFKSMQAEFNAQKKAATATQDEGTLLFNFDKVF